MPLDLICPKRAVYQVFVSKGAETTEQRDHAKCHSGSITKCVFISKS